MTGFAVTGVATGNERQPTVARRCVTVMLTNVGADDQTDRQHEPADPGMTKSNRAAHQTPSHLSDFKVDPFRYSQQKVSQEHRKTIQTQTGGASVGKLQVARRRLDYQSCVRLPSVVCNVCIVDGYRKIV